jgi:hypothetical protein
MWSGDLVGWWLMQLYCCMCEGFGMWNEESGVGGRSVGSQTTPEKTPTEQAHTRVSQAKRTAVDHQNDAG